MSALEDRTEDRAEDSTEARIAQLEAEVAIRRLVASYAVAYDARDLETLSGLYAPRIRDAAMAELTPELPAGRTFHLLADPVITFSGPDTASGEVVCRAEREAGSEWIISGVTYSDAYVRMDGDWYLLHRTTATAYAADVLSRP